MHTKNHPADLLMITPRCSTGFRKKQFSCDSMVWGEDCQASAAQSRAPDVWPLPIKVI